VADGKQVLLDSNVVLRIIVGDIPAQRDAAMRLVMEARGQCAVADIVFIELEYALRHHYKMSRKEVSALLKAFSEHPKITCSREWLAYVLGFYGDAPAVSFIDIALAAYARFTNMTLYTFDKKLANQMVTASLVDTL